MCAGVTLHHLGMLQGAFYHQLCRHSVSGGTCSDSVGTVYIDRNDSLECRSQVIADEQVEDSQQQGGTVAVSEITLCGALN